MWKFWRDFPGFEKERRKIKPHKSKHKIFEEKQEIHETEKQCVENPKRWKLWTAIAWLEKRGKRSLEKYRSSQNIFQDDPGREN